ncbi:MAG: conserved hypothetical protein, membrane [Candidatus Syntrophoarchaeum caldarius]|uniref:Urease accessory protein UreH-like transmembrane domain-containing protein n=1 Tax=Candidatus Syntropharchaeum caldarium TaxID=1838285 RepID=A0A1F2P9M0_9EURY|nr:MAG: conserved hypothetical protein, membrane [Candidatus Syntrophoarchaeum caldarius]
MEALTFVVAIATIAILHTIVPDHYLPISMLALAKRWDQKKIVKAVLLVGSAHVSGSILIGLIALVVGLEFSAYIASFVENLAGYLLCGFGVLYAVMALHGHHSHRHYPHHHDDHDPHHDETLYSLALILGMMPCIPAIPIFVIASLKGAMLGAITMITFAVLTILTMGVLVYLTNLPGRKIPPQNERRANIIAGVVIFLTGLFILIFELKRRIMDELHQRGRSHRFVNTNSDRNNQSIRCNKVNLF